MEAHTTILPPISLSHTKLSHLNLLPSLEDTHGKNTRFPYIYIYIYMFIIYPFIVSFPRFEEKRSLEIFESFLLNSLRSLLFERSAEEGEGRLIAPRDDICLRLLPLPSDRRSTISERSGRGK